MTTTGTSTDQRHTTDVLAIIALVLAFVVPPLGALLALYGGRDGGKLSGLRMAAILIGVIGTVMATLVGIMVFAGENAASR